MHLLTRRANNEWYLDDIWSHNFHNAIKSRAFQKNVIYLQHQDRHNMQVVVGVMGSGSTHALSVLLTTKAFIVTITFLHPLSTCLLCLMTTPCTMLVISMIKIGETFNYLSQSTSHQTIICVMAIKLVIIPWHIEILGKRSEAIGKQVASHGK